VAANDAKNILHVYTSKYCVNSACAMCRIPKVETTSFLEKTLPNLLVKIGDTVSARFNLVIKC